MREEDDTPGGAGRNEIRIQPDIAHWDSDRPRTKLHPPVRLNAARRETLTGTRSGYEETRSMISFAEANTTFWRQKRGRYFAAFPEFVAVV